MAIKESSASTIAHICAIYTNGIWAFIISKIQLTTIYSCNMNMISYLLLYLLLLNNII